MYDAHYSYYEEAQLLDDAADELEHFRSNHEPRTALLTARWLRSYASDLRAAPSDRHTPLSDEALDLARHILGR